MVGVVRIKEVYQKRYCILPMYKRIFSFQIEHLKCESLTFKLNILNIDISYNIIT